ncbi:hypothetical protein M422DRAFT_171633 [Sphaerobolus stellatus SS14]|uniref:Fungal-type protein kinase domain-containing protein n=1 Tax=Sphaerobolus stellatus (strain SS14) TaxID=990650 RepID=A0A0C9UG03_SPHS4|nr:hypothetical protein M422DRAFT_171633 [Sphaerobolus stellatus SS14]
MFSSVAGSFGVPVILIEPYKNQPEITTDSFVPGDFEPCDWCGEWPKASKKETRVQSRVLILTRGKLLTSARGPKQLLQGVIYAMLGHWILFKAGWLHRDVSIGNVLLMMEPEPRNPVEAFSNLGELYFNECVGFIIDGDLAVKWNNLDHEDALRRSGTPPFMSINLIQSWLSGEEIYHTPIDDLESFIWVLLWAIFDILPKKRIQLTPVEQRYNDSLRSNSLGLLGVKGGLLDDLDIRPLKKWSSGFRAFAPLLKEWLTLAKQARAEMIAFEDSPPTDVEFYKNYYAQYLEIGVKYLNDLPEDWPYVPSLSS